MGGSGGGGFLYGSSPEQIAKEIRNQEERTKSNAYNTAVTGLINDLLTNLNNRDNDTLKTHLDGIERALHKEIDGFIDLRYAGSVAKHTYVDGLSDIDSLAIINESELSEKTPQKVKEYFYKQIQARFPNTDVTIGKLAVTIKFTSGFEIQILPAIKTDIGIRIPSSRRANEWSNIIRPDNFAKLLRFSNTCMSGKLVPAIKLAKSIIASFPESRQLSGYHVESLAIETFAKYQGEKKLKPMLKHFFTEGAKCILNPIRDKTGQSVHVDDYLGAPNSVNRKMVSDSMSTVVRRMQNADGSEQVWAWEQLLK
jgi:hypothetical protein